MELIFCYVLWQEFPCRLDACFFVFFASSSPVPALVDGCFFYPPCAVFAFGFCLDNGHFTIYVYCRTCMASSEYSCFSVFARYILAVQMLYMHVFIISLYHFLYSVLGVTHVRCILFFRFYCGLLWLLLIAIGSSYLDCSFLVI